MSTRRLPKPKTFAAPAFAERYGAASPVPFALFFVSGFCGLLYQVVWTRMAFASFGITVPVLSVVISVFMLGLALGSWAGGRLVRGGREKRGFSAAHLYAAAEAIIGISAFAVPGLFKFGERILSQAGQMDSFRYLFSSALVLSLAILPWCMAMGATFPLMMAYVREREPESTKSFSYLYLANVLGAMAGTLLTAFVFVELLGFRHTLWVAAAGNFIVAAVSARLGLSASSVVRASRSPSPRPSPQAEGVVGASAERGPQGEGDSPGAAAALPLLGERAGVRGIGSSDNPETSASLAAQKSDAGGLAAAKLPNEGGSSILETATAPNVVTKEKEAVPTQPTPPYLGVRGTLKPRKTPATEQAAPSLASPKPDESGSPRGTWQATRRLQWLLFTTGFCAMAMEVVWTRAFTPVVKTQVYSFALVLAAYLGATYLGSLLYRRSLNGGWRPSRAQLIFLLCVSTFLPIIINDAHWLAANWSSDADPISVVVLLGSICPFCAVLGFLTPNLVDDYSGGSPSGAGKAYALNVIGCILGPLVAGYLLLPFLPERFSLIILALPFCVFAFLCRRELPGKQQRTFAIAAAVAFAWSALISRTYEEALVGSEKRTETRRDYTASVTSFEDDQSQKHLLVNGIGMTRLNPVTKFMAHLPLAFHRGKPESALVICFGMGTTYRSVLSWDINTTAVELVPSVPKQFEFYHEDASRCLQNAKGRIIIDDGRRFLNRTREKFDVIILDPPPPVEAAGSSLLYAKEFYEVAKQRLNTNGILQAWFPGGEAATLQAVMRSVTESFPHVRCFTSLGKWGTHILASMEPLEALTDEQLAAKLPESAIHDLMEWSQASRSSVYLAEVLGQEVSPKDMLAANPRLRITDDRPFNEYYFLRRTFSSD